MTRVDPYEELASLFLTDDRSDLSTPDVEESRGGAAGATRPDRSGPPIGAPIEVAIVGHLPVMGGLWLTQYADQLGRREGPTALVRLERGQVTLELLRAPGHRGGLETIDTLDEALHLLAGVARRWVVCPQGEAAIDGPFPGDALTLLSGSDDAATVAAYRIVKGLAERWHHAGWPVPPVGLVVLGAATERVAQVAEKLDRTTKAFLDVDLDVVGHYQRMDAIESAGRRTFAGLELGVDDVCRRIRLAAARAPRPSDATIPRPDADVPVAKLGPKGLVREMAREAQRTRAASSGADQASRSPIGTRAESAESDSMRMPEVSWAAVIPEIDPLPIRCPMHASVELAVDASGSLHLVAADDALASLRAVEAWSVAHSELLRLACPRLVSLDRITTHVITRDARSIIPLHGTGLQLHLAVATQDGWVHVALN